MSIGKGAATGAALGSIVPGVGTVIGGAIGAVGGGIASLLGGKGNKAEQEAYQRYLDNLYQQNLLSPEDYVAAYQEIDPTLLQSVTPELEQAIQMQDTSLAGIETDPRLRQAQMDVLSKLSRSADQGLTVEDEAARNEIMRSIGTQERGRQEAILQDMARRGQLGSGTELAARMASSGQAYDQAARQGEALAAERQRNAMSAALQKANVASGLEQSDYDKAANEARARDAINQFNVSQQSGAQTRNIASKNIAAQNQADLANKAYLQNLTQKNTQAEQLVGGKVAQTSAEQARQKAILDAELGKAGKKTEREKEVGGAIGGVASGIGDVVKSFL